MIDLKIVIAAIAEEGDLIKDYTSHRCEDLKSAYHQYPLSKKSVLASACRYRGRVLVCQTMMYGPAPCVIIANSILEVATQAISVRTKKYVRPYIDDVIQSPAYPDEIRPHLLALGYYLAEKTQAGPRVNYTGFTIFVL